MLAITKMVAAITWTLREDFNLHLTTFGQASFGRAGRLLRPLRAGVGLPTLKFKIFHPAAEVFNGDGEEKSCFRTGEIDIHLFKNL